MSAHSILISPPLWPAPWSVLLPCGPKTATLTLLVSAAPCLASVPSSLKTAIRRPLPQSWLNFARAIQKKLPIIFRQVRSNHGSLKSAKAIWPAPLVTSALSSAIRKHRLSASCKRSWALRRIFVALRLSRRKVQLVAIPAKLSLSKRASQIYSSACPPAETGLLPGLHLPFASLRVPSTSARSIPASLLPSP